jgi:transcriptional antiterminator
MQPKTPLHEVLEKANWKDLFDEHYGKEKIEDERISQEYKYQINDKYYVTLNQVSEETGIPQSTLQWQLANNKNSQVKKL